jgi:hypothetical protein
LLSIVVTKVGNGDGKRMLSSFASSLVSIFHEPGKHFEILSIIEDVFRVCFAKNTSSLLRSISGLTCLPVTQAISKNSLFINSRIQNIRLPDVQVILAKENEKNKKRRKR